MDESTNGSEQHANADIRRALGNDVAAQIRYAHLAPFDEALAIARQLLEEGTWDGAHAAFRGLVDNKLRRCPDWSRFALELLEALQLDQLRHNEIRGVAHELILSLAWNDEPSFRGAVVSWFVRVAGPGEASVAISMVRFQRVEPADVFAMEPWCHPLVPWLVDHGGAELVRGRDRIVNLLVVSVCHTHYPERLIGALKIIERADKVDAVFAFDARSEQLLHPAIEAALGRGLSTEWVHQVLGGAHGALNTIGCDRFFAPFDPARGMPRLRRALLEALAAGTWRGGLGTEVWERAFLSPPAEPLTFTDEGLEVALRALMDACRSKDVDGIALTPWVEVIASAWLEKFGLRHPSVAVVQGVWALDLLAGEPKLALGIARALSRALTAASTEDVQLDRARQVMTRITAEPRLASVALLLLPQDSVGETRAPHVALDEVQPLLQTIVRAEWSRPIVGIDARMVFRGAREVRITEPGELDASILIEFRGDTMMIGDTQGYRRIISKMPNREDALAVCALYFAHEVFHVLQGLRLKPSVSAMRSSGSEHALAHLDLEADDFAARIVAATTDWSLEYLKDIEGKGAMAFPASMRHTNASVLRKSVRLSGLRADYLLRKQERFGVTEHAEGYASVEVPFGAGALLFMWNGRYTELLASSTIDAGEADELTRSSRDQASLDALDKKLVALLDRASRSS